MKIGARVNIVLKEDQRSGKLGSVQDSVSASDKS